MTPRALVLLAAAALAVAPGAEAQFACSPTRLSAGAQLHLTSAGTFGASMPARFTATAANDRGVSTPLSILSWAASDVTVRVPAGLAPGAYAVVLAAPGAPPQRQPACFTVVPALVAAPLAPRTVSAGVVLSTLDMAVDGDLPCSGDTKITLWGKHFRAGTEARAEAPGGWISGRTAVELGGEGRPYPVIARTWAPPRLVVRDPGTIEVTLSRCILLVPGLKVRLWFPDGTKSAWQTVRTEWNHPGSGATLLEH
jgi:hypothetical protein